MLEIKIKVLNGNNVDKEILAIQVSWPLALRANSNALPKVDDAVLEIRSQRLHHDDVIALSGTQIQFFCL